MADAAAARLVHIEIALACRTADSPPSPSRKTVEGTATTAPSTVLLGATGQGRKRSTTD